MDVTALVVNYNAGPLLLDCVSSLQENAIADIRVVDNASTDDSFRAFTRQFANAPGVVAVANPHNLGFGPAINAALDNIQSRYVLIINPDCRLEPGAIQALLHAMETKPGAGLAGPLVVDPQGRVEAASHRRFATPWRALMTYSGLARLDQRFPSMAGVRVAVTEGEREQAAIAVEATSGACMLVRTQVLRELGGFDEAYGLHCEDLDLMYRLRQARRGVLFVPAARAVHQQGVSSASRPLWVHRQKHRGMARFFNQHIAQQHAWPVKMLVRAGIWLRWALLWPLVVLRR